MSATIQVVLMNGMLKPEQIADTPTGLQGVLLGQVIECHVAGNGR
jgi:hypothetical protein